MKISAARHTIKIAWWVLNVNEGRLMQYVLNAIVEIAGVTIC